MIKEFTLDGKQVTLKCTAATPYRFKSVFKGMDILKTLSNEKALDENGTDHSIRLMYIMAMTAEGKSMDTLNEETFVEWLDNYSMGTIIDNIDAVVEFFGETQETTSAPKK